MFPFCCCLTNRTTHHPVGPAMEDYSLFMEPSYHALIRQDTTRWADLGTYRA